MSYQYWIVWYPDTSFLLYPVQHWVLGGGSFFGLFQADMHFYVLLCLVLVKNFVVGGG